MTIYFNLHPSHLELGGLSELHHAFHELSAAAIECRAIVSLNDQFIYAGMLRSIRLPPAFQAIDDKITGFCRLSKVDRKLIMLHIENPKWYQGCVPIVVMVIGVQGFLSVGFTASRKIADGDFRFAVDRESQRFWIRICGAFRGGHILENGIGFWNFFVRLHLLCFFRL
jgi:hypothetical protein